MTKIRKDIYQMSFKVPILVTLLFLGFLLLGIWLNGQAEGLIITVFFAWVLLGVPVIRSWGILLEEDGIKDGRKLPWGTFRPRRSLLFSDVGAVDRNGAGDIVLFNKVDYRFPGKKEIILPRNVKGFEELEVKVLSKVSFELLDEEMKRKVEGFKQSKIDDVSECD